MYNKSWQEFRSGNIDSLVLYFTCFCVLLTSRVTAAQNGCPKQDCIVVPPPSNIMEVQKNKL